MNDYIHSLNLILNICVVFLTLLFFVSLLSGIRGKIGEYIQDTFEDGTAVFIIMFIPVLSMLAGMYVFSVSEVISDFSKEYTENKAFYDSLDETNVQHTSRFDVFKNRSITFQDSNLILNVSRKKTTLKLKSKESIVTYKLLLYSDERKLNAASFNFKKTPYEIKTDKNQIIKVSEKTLNSRVELDSSLYQN